ncbi:putative coiled-coil domain-containing protein [Apostichopus japonicus]|uniref:Putative coiled-coil domain-containing protein n=1 Tax=Stichopus japonicus TaxID=307972 RepID=A0A2G8KDJ0_STIJA|nr:putative coiled-coil domain-containing protein [Apostichopus japonicus]
MFKILIPFNFDFNLQMNMESRRRRRHIPPSKLKERHPQNTEALLQQKLDVAENETGNLMKQLSMLGFVPEKMSRDADRSSKDKSESMTPISPYTSKNVVDPQRLHKSYEVLVTRVCKAESQIQTLKLNLCTLQAEKDIYGTEADKVRDQLLAQEEKHEENEKKLKSDLENCKRDLERALNERRTTEEEMMKIKEELSRLAQKQTETSDASNGLEEHKVNNQRLTRKLSELTTELSHEVDLRKSLEDSHFTLLQRIKDTEGIVEGERREMQKLVNVYTKLTDEKEKLREEKNQLEFNLNPLKEKIKKLSAELGLRDIRLTEALQENQVGLMMMARDAPDIRSGWTIRPDSEQLSGSGGYFSKSGRIFFKSWPDLFQIWPELFLKKVAVAAADGMKRQRAELQQELENLTEKYKTLSAEVGGRRKI